MIGVQRHLEQPREDLGKGVMTELEDSSGSLIRTSCTALVYLLKAPTPRLLRQTFLSVLLAAHLQHSGSSPAAVAQRIRAVYSTVVGLIKEVCDAERPSKDHRGASLCLCLSVSVSQIQASRKLLVHQQHEQQVQDLTAANESQDRQIELLQRRGQLLEGKFRGIKQSTKSNKATDTPQPPTHQSSTTSQRIHARNQWRMHHHYPLHSAPTTTFHHVPSRTDTSS